MVITYLDTSENISKCITNAGLIITNQYETAFANIFVAVKV